MTMFIPRLYSGILPKFHMDGSFQKLIDWICRELKMMKNDTNMTFQLQNFELENQLLNFCVGKIVGGKSPEVS